METKQQVKQNYRHSRLAWSYARHFAALSSWFRTGLRFAAGLQRLFGAQRCEAFSRRLRKLTANRTPLWLSTTPGRSRPVYARNELIRPSKESTVVYWPTCITQTFGKGLDDDRENIPVVVARVLQKAGLNVVYPQPTRGLCCGQALARRGYLTAADVMLEEVVSALWDISSAGRYPILVDTSACTSRVKERAQSRGIQLYDSSEFIDKFLIDRLSIEPEVQKVAAYIPNSCEQVKAQASFKRVMDRLAPGWVRTSIEEPEKVDISHMKPEESELLVSEKLKPVEGCVYGVSNSRLCEAVLSRYSGITFYSLFELLDRQSESLSTHN